MATDGRGVSDDDHAGTFDDTRNGEFEEARPDAQGIPEASALGVEIASFGGSDDERPAIEKK